LVPPSTHYDTADVPYIFHICSIYDPYMFHIYIIMEYYRNIFGL